MKKIRYFFLLSALTTGLVLTSCSSNDDLTSSTSSAKGDTYVAISLTMPSSSSTSANAKSTRANSDQNYNYIGQWVGKDEIKTVDIYLDDGSTVTDSSFTVGGSTSDGYTVTTSGNDLVLKPKKAIKTTAGDKNVYVVINKNDAIASALNSTNSTEFKTAYANALELTNTGSATTDVSTSASKLATASDSDLIVMTNTSDGPTQITVKAGVTEAQTLTETAPENRAAVTVQRTVGRVMVTSSATIYTVKGNDGTTTLGTISDIKWVLAQGEKSLFVQQKSPYETPNYSWVSTTDDDYITNAGSKYDYSGLFEGYKTTEGAISGTEVPTLAAYKDPTAAGIGDSSILNGKFILPTTHAYADAPATSASYTGGYRKGNTAYVLVRAKYTPASYADSETNPNTDGTFYLGANGKYYTSAANAVDPNHGGVAGQTVAKYVGGKVLYYAWVNPDIVATPYNSPVLRNNIYHIHITGFKTIGTNWNPLYPEDPDTTNPTNPDPKPKTDGTTEPTNPIDPTDPLTVPETWMSVDVTILPWNVHSYSTELGF